jgi:hypothetical protein
MEAQNDDTFRNSANQTINAVDMLDTYVAPQVHRRKQTAQLQACPEDRRSASHALICRIVAAYRPLCQTLSNPRLALHLAVDVALLIMTIPLSDNIVELHGPRAHAEVSARGYERDGGRLSELIFVHQHHFLGLPLRKLSRFRGKSGLFCFIRCFNTS